MSRSLQVFCSVMVALLAGICQIAVFLSLMLGTQNFVDHAIKRGSRLNRLEIKPIYANLEKPDRFPERTAPAIARRCAGWQRLGRCD